MLDIDAMADTIIIVLFEAAQENGFYFWVHWLSRQMPDHYPIWIEINTDSSVTFLEGKYDDL